MLYVYLLYYIATGLSAIIMAGMVYVLIGFGENKLMCICPCIFLNYCFSFLLKQSYHIHCYHVSLTMTKVLRFLAYLA